MPPNYHMHTLTASHLYEMLNPYSMKVRAFSTTVITVTYRSHGVVMTSRGVVVTSHGVVVTSRGVVVLC